MNEDAKAMPYFDIIIQIGIKDPDAFIYKGNLLERKGDYQGAYDNYEKALKYNPDCVWVYNNMASALIGLQKYDEALEYTDKSLRVNYDKEISYNNKGKIFYGNGKKDVALKYYDLAIKEVSNFSEAHVNKIKLLLELRRTDEALEACDEAIENNVKDYRVFVEKAAILKDMANYEETIKYEKEKSHISAVRDLKAELDEARGLAEKYEREYDLNKVAELKYGKIPELERKIKEQEASMEKDNENALLKEEVTEKLRALGFSQFKSEEKVAPLKTIHDSMDRIAKIDSEKFFIKEELSAFDEEYKTLELVNEYYENMTVRKEATNNFILTLLSSIL